MRDDGEGLSSVPAHHAPEHLQASQQLTGDDAEKAELDRLWEELRSSQAAESLAVAAEKPEPEVPVETMKPKSLCEAALERMEGRGGLCPGELDALPEDYGANLDGDNAYAHHGERFLPEDYGEEEPARERAGDPQNGGLIWSSEYRHRAAYTVGDIQRQMPKPDKLKDLVKYKGPFSSKHVLKQAVTNAELEKAVQAGDSDKVAAILRFGDLKRRVNVNCVLWPKRERLLHLAAQGDHRDICIMLLEARAEIDCEEISDGRHPLHDACAKGSYDAVELLLDRRARIEECTFTGMRPLHWASAHGHPDVVDLLLDRRASIGASSCNSYQAMHHAANGGHAAVVRLLCKRGAKVDAEANDRRPIHLACLASHLDAAAVLMDFDALGVMAEFGPTGLLKKYQRTPIEEFMRTIEQLRFHRDEAEELIDMGETDEAKHCFEKVVRGFMELGFVHSATGTLEDASRCGVPLDPELVRL